ncbi:MAG: hypothetical protein HQM09_12315 [Candidatus Riflebacteria bacterium]|nr:hypothetical protein [Candidatus Riflebacteria bacterium]
MIRQSPRNVVTQIAIATRHRRGFVIPFAIMAIIAFGLLIFSFSRVSQGNRLKIAHLSKTQNSFYIASSSLANMLARLHSSGWANRSFRDAPTKESAMPLLGGDYDLHVENSPGKDFQADVYIRTRFGGLTKLYFWRIAYRDDLLDISNRPQVILFTAPKDDVYPKTGQPNTFPGFVDGLLNTRTLNQDMATDLANKIAKMGNVQDIVSLAADATGNMATATSEFKDPARLTIPLNQVAALPPDTYPSPNDGKGILPGSHYPGGIGAPAPPNSSGASGWTPSGGGSTVGLPPGGGPSNSAHTGGSGSSAYGATVAAVSDPAANAAAAAAGSAAAAQAAAGQAAANAGASPAAAAAAQAATTAAAAATSAAATAAAAAADAAAIAAGTASSGAYQSAAEATAAAQAAAADAAAAAQAAVAAAAAAQAAADKAAADAAAAAAAATAGTGTTP